MATVDELVTRAGKTGLYTEQELTALRAALGPGAKSEDKDAALDGLFKRLEAAAEKAKAAASGTPAATTEPATVTASASASAPASSTTQTDAQWLASAPVHVRKLVERAAAQEAAQRVALITSIRAATSNPFTEDELKAFPIEQLQKLAALAAPADSRIIDPAAASLGYDYSALGAVFPDVPRTAAIQPVPDPYEEALAAQRAARGKTN